MILCIFILSRINFYLNQVAPPPRQVSNDGAGAAISVKKREDEECMATLFGQVAERTVLCRSYSHYTAEHVWNFMDHWLARTSRFKAKEEGGGNWGGGGGLGH